MKDLNRVKQMYVYQIHICRLNQSHVYFISYSEYKYRGMKVNVLSANKQVSRQNTFTFTPWY